MRFAAIIGAALFALASTCFANDYTVGSIRVEHPWSRATPKSANIASGYLVIENRGTAPDRLALAHGPLDPGSHSVAWNGLDESGRRVPAGIYLVRLRSEAGSWSSTDRSVVRSSSIHRSRSISILPRTHACTIPPSAVG